VRSRPVRPLLCLTLLCLGSQALLPAQSGPPDSAAITNAFAAELRSRLDLPGIAVAVGVDGRVVANEMLGWADVEGQIPVRPASLFRVGSLSKLLTATVALRLRQAGTFDLDAPLHRYLTAVPEDKANITARQLLGHLAGFPHYGRADYISTTKFANVDDVLTRMLAMPLIAPPGTKYAYSSYGFNVLGSALQAAGRREFRSMVAAEVTTPLGMSRTISEALPATESRTRLYSRGAQNEITVGPPSDVSDRWPSGGFLSTAEDLVRFGMGILRPAYLRNELREMAFSSQRDQDGKDTNVGLAWRIGRDENGRRYVHHGGDAVGGRAFLLVYPDLKVAVAITTNIGSAAFNEKDALVAARPFVH
jgi:serine beta-lactamase-like protein LACTB, mitochondrial